MKRLIIVHGLKRSGNTGILNWIKAHDRFLFYKNMIPIRFFLEGRDSASVPMDFKLWLSRKKISKKLPFVAPFFGTFYRDRSVLVSLEDHDLQIQPFDNVPCGITNVLIIRDIRNLLSSRIRKSSVRNRPEAYPKEDGPHMQRILNLWKSHAREYLGVTTHLENRVCIYFDSWFSNKEYRMKISSDLGLEFTDIGFSEVSARGLGSSFDGTQFNGDNKKMDVLNRTRYLSDSEKALLDKLLEDEELQELNNRIRALHQSPQK